MIFQIFQSTRVDYRTIFSNVGNFRFQQLHERPNRFPINCEIGRSSFRKKKEEEEKEEIIS